MLPERDRGEWPKLPSDLRRNCLCPSAFSCANKHGRTKEDTRFPFFEGTSGLISAEQEPSRERMEVQRPVLATRCSFRGCNAIERDSFAGFRWDMSSRVPRRSPPYAQVVMGIGCLLSARPLIKRKIIGQSTVVRSSGRANETVAHNRFPRSPASPDAMLGSAAAALAAPLAACKECVPLAASFSARAPGM